MNLKCYFCSDQYGYTNPHLSPNITIPHKNPIIFLKNHFVEYHKFPPNITSSEVRYIFDLMIKEEISLSMLRDKEDEEKTSFKLKFPEKLRDHIFYERQLKKIFIHFICNDPASKNIPNESEHNLYPREVDKEILNGREPPSEIYFYDEFFYEYNEESWWMTHEIQM